MIQLPRTPWLHARAQHSGANYAGLNGHMRWSPETSHEARWRTFHASIGWQRHHGHIFPGGLDAEQALLWGRDRYQWLVGARLQSKSNLDKRNPVLAAELSGEGVLGGGVAGIGTLRPESLHRIQAEVAGYAPRWTSLGLFIRYVHGQDYYNVLFIRDLHLVQFGVMLDSGDRVPEM